MKLFLKKKKIKTRQVTKIEEGWGEKISNKNSINQHPQRLWQFGGYFQGLSYLRVLIKENKDQLFLQYFGYLYGNPKASLCSFPLWLQDREYLGSFVKRDSFWTRVSSPVSPGLIHHMTWNPVYSGRREGFAWMWEGNHMGNVMLKKEMYLGTSLLDVPVCAQSRLTLWSQGL